MEHAINGHIFKTIEELKTYLKLINKKAVINEIIKLNNGDAIIIYQTIENPHNR